MERDNQGALFKNDKKGNDKAPDYKGKVQVNGEEMEIAAWVTKSKKGTTYMSLKFSEPWRPKGKQVDSYGVEYDDSLDDAIPF